MDSIFDFFWNLSPVFTISIMLVILLVFLFRKKIAMCTCKNIILKKLAKLAVHQAETMVFLLGKEKYALAVQYLNSMILQKYKIAIPDAIIEEFVSWAYEKMVADKQEIKASSVLMRQKDAFKFSQ